MKNLLLIAFSIFWLPSMIMGQQRCLPDTLGLFNNDEPPGCSFCNQIFTFSTGSKTAETFSFEFPCGEVENSQWFTLKPDINGTLNAFLNTYDCENENGIEAAIYDQDFNLVSECLIFTKIDEIIVDNLNVEEPYYLMVDGVRGDICNVTLVTFNSLYAIMLDSEPIVANHPTPFCVGTEICFSIPRVNHAIEYEWTFTNSHEIVNGGGLQDTFLCLILNGDEPSRINVTPISPCIPGVLETFEIKVKDEITQFIDTTICEGTCLQIKDSCFFESGAFSFAVENSEGQCDSIIAGNIRYGTIFPSPKINCSVESGQLFLDWDKPSGASSYDVIINRDSITTAFDNFILLEGLPEGMLLNIKIQPKGSCTYLPAETSCIIGTTSTNDNFLNNKISVYPNPTTGNFNIKTDLEIEEIQIFDSTGRFFQIEKTTSFELENRAAGIYFLKIKTNEGVGVKRVLVKN